MDENHDDTKYPPLFIESPHRTRCYKCKKPFPEPHGRPVFYSLKGTQLSDGSLGKAFRYCGQCFSEIRELLSDYIQPKSNEKEAILCYNECPKHCKEEKNEK